MELLNKREDYKDQILKAQFIKRQLNEEAKDIDQSQTTLMRRRGFESPEFYSSRGFSVEDNMLKYDHLKKHRYVDMKRMSGKPKKSHPVHNRILFGHANEIVKRMSFGYTEAAKQQMKEFLEANSKK